MAEFTTADPVMRRAWEINKMKADLAGGCWSGSAFCDDTNCECARASLDQAKDELHSGHRAP